MSGSGLPRSQEADDALLDANAVLTEAEAQVGIGGDPGSASFRRSLEVVVAALNADANLTEEGEERVRASLVSRAVERIGAAKWVGDHPEIADEPISDPVFSLVCLVRVRRSSSTCSTTTGGSG